MHFRERQNEEEQQSEGNTVAENSFIRAVEQEPGLGEIKVKG